ncbi:unnamed protein product [Coregonus sp. 'balchen']|nr:unnamed protein product [Coregonus sp. 'balchen']
METLTLNARSILYRYPFPTVFSTCSKKDLAASLEKGVGMCLYNMPEVKVLYGGQKCGNGYVEEGEECDCGELEECMNPCCNATTCTLKGDAVCAHGQCCEDCRLKPAGTPCRESSNSCDLPEFCTGANPHCPANVYLHDGHSCHKVDGYCYNGICQTHEQQCITLWGPGAKPAPGICFERVNSAGDPYGNCGKDSKGLFAKCEARKEGGSCVGGHMSTWVMTCLTLDWFWLAPRMCLNRQCQNVSVFGVHQCSGKCSGRGVCNNKKNCHCEEHWAPPFCERVGFGGSLDSGPMRLAADSRVVAVAILATLLSLMGAGFLVFLKRKTLVRLLFTNKKTTMDKLRSVGSTRATSLSQTQSMYSSRHKPPAKPPGASVYKPSHRSSEPLLPPHSLNSHSLRRLPHYQPIHISHPMPVFLSVGQQPLPPVPPHHRALPAHTALSPPRAPPFHSLPRQQPYRMDQDREKPSPPQKPLPADPLGRRARVESSNSGGGGPPPWTHPHRAQTPAHHPTTKQVCATVAWLAQSL